MYYQLIKIAQLKHEFMHLTSGSTDDLNNTNNVYPNLNQHYQQDLDMSGYDTLITRRNLKLGNDLGGGITGSFSISYHHHQHQQSAMISTYFSYDAKVEIVKRLLTRITSNNTTSLSAFFGEQGVLTINAQR